MNPFLSIIYDCELGILKNIEIESMYEILSILNMK